MFSSDEQTSSESDEGAQEEDEEGSRPIDDDEGEAGQREGQDALETPLPIPQAIERWGIVHSLVMDKEEDESADSGDDEISAGVASPAETFGTDEEWERAVSRRLEE
jgi:hypothetical protein